MITFTIIFAYLIVTFAIGYALKRRSGKDTTARKFFVADGTMPLFAVSTLLFGDLIAASTTTGTAGVGYSTGITALWGIWGSSLGCLLFSVLFCKFFFKIRKTGAYTGPEAFGIRFNEKIRYLVLIFTLIPLIIIFSTQITAGSMYLSSICGISEKITKLLVCAVFLAMSLLGITGMAEMNKLHSFVIFFGLTFAAIVCVQHVGGVKVLVETLPSSYFDLFPKGVPTAVAQCVGGALGFSLSVTSVNVGYVAKDIGVAKRSHVIVAIISALFAFAPTSIGLCAAVSMTGIRPDLALFEMTNSVSPYLSGLAVMAVFAAIFSTGPYFLIEISKLVVKELLIPIGDKRNVKMSERTTLNVSRAVIVAALVIAAAISGTNVSLLNSLMSASQIKAIAVVLLIFGLYWKRTSNNAGFIGLLSGGTIATIWYFAGNPLGVQPLWPGLILSVAIIVVGSLIECAGSKVSQDYLAYEKRFEQMSKHFSMQQAPNEIN